MCSPQFDDEVVVAPAGVPSPGRLTMPTNARGVVMSAGIGHGIRHHVGGPQVGSSHLGTLRFELLSDEELRDDHHEADVEILAIRFLAVTRWVRRLPACAALPVGLLGAGTAGVAAIWAASEDTEIGAVVARDSRLEQVRGRLPAVFAPTLLVVEAGDPEVRLQNERSGRRLRCEHRIAMITEGTSRDGRDQRDAGDRLACEWFVDHLGRPPAAGRRSPDRSPRL